jgi:hypothetical protein
LKQVAAVLLVIGLSSAAFGMSKAYDVVPFGGCVAQTTMTPNEVIQYYRNTLDSLSVVCVWIGDTLEGQPYQVVIKDSVTGLPVAEGPSNGVHASKCWSWLNIPLAKDARPVRGRTYKVIVSRAGGGGISFAYDSMNPYKYGCLVVGNQAHPTEDLALRVIGLINSTDSAYFGVDDCHFVGWYRGDSANRENLRYAAADSARAAGIGSMMVYACWPELVGDNDTTLSWSEFDAHLWEVKRAGCNPVINIQQVAKYASSRQDSIWKRTWIGDDTTHDSGYWFYYRVWDTAVFCAPINLFASIEDDTNYWARYVESLVTHIDQSPSGNWSGGRPCDFCHTWEIWNEPNDTCVNSMMYLDGVTGFWRRPTAPQYSSGFDDLPGLCALYERMAYVAAEVIRAQAGHEYDTILIGSTHRVLAEDTTVLAMGKKFVWNCYEIAENEYGSVFWDGVSFHPYQPGRGFRPGLFEESAESLHAVARSHGDYDCQVWCTEVDILYPPFPTDSGHYQDDAMQYLPQLYTTALASQALPGASYDRCQWFFYGSINLWWPIRYGLIGLYRTYTNDSIWNDSTWINGYWEKFSSYYTYQGLVSQLVGRRVEQRMLAGNPAIDTQFRLYQFEEPDGRKKWVGWAVDTAGGGPESCVVRIPVRTDQIALDNLQPYGRDSVSADSTSGWLNWTLHPRATCFGEVGTVKRPDLVVDSLKMVPPVLGVGQPATARVYFHNAGNDTTPEGPLAGEYALVVLRHNGDSIAESLYHRPLGHDDTGSVSISVDSVRASWRGNALFDATVNYGQQYVEMNGMDDNCGYSLNRVVRFAEVDSPYVACGSHHNEPVALLGLESHAYEVDTTGAVPCESARVVQSWYGLNDTVVHAADTTPWFHLNPATTTFDTSLRFMCGQGKYRILVEAKDSWSISELVPDSAHSYVYFDTTGPTGSIVINHGASRFTTTPICTLSLAASDSCSGVAQMRLMNVPRVSLVLNGSFAAAGGGWSFNGGGSGYDTTLGLARLATGASTCVRQFIPAESISAHSGDSCVLQASILALMHGGDALGDVAYFNYFTRQDTSVHDTSMVLVDSATFQDSLAFWGQSPYGGNSLSRRFLLTAPSAESGWVWRGGMVRVQAVGINGATGTVWVDQVALNGFQPDTGYAWWGPYDTLTTWNIGTNAGEHIVTALQMDSAGNENGTAIADTIILDPTAPVVHISLPSLGQMINGSAVEITGWAYDSIEVSGDSWFHERRLLYRSFDSTNWRPVSPDSVSHTPAYANWQYGNPAVHLGYWNTNPIPNGQYYLKLTAADSAGNISSCSTWVMIFHGGGGGNFVIGPEGGGTGMGEGSVYVGSATGRVLHLSEDLDSLDCWQVSDSSSQAYVTSILEVSDDSVLVLDARNKRIHKLHRNGQGRRRLVSNLSLPMDLKKDANGNVWLVDKGLHRIGKFRSDGTPVFVRGGLGTDSLHFHSPEGIAVKGSIVYVADTKNDRIVAYDTSGNYQTTITGDFQNPTSVLVTDSGTIYLTDGIDGNLKGITPLGGNIVTIGTADSSKLRGLVLSENKHNLFSLATEVNKVYRLQIQSDESMPGGVQSSGGVKLPRTLSFAQPFPNPARTRLNIAYALPRATRVSVRLYDAAGKLVNTLASGEKKPGYYNLTWNRQDAKGRSCPCGVYFCTLSAENQRFSRKVVLTE